MLYISVSKDMGICNYFSKLKWVREQKRLGITGLAHHPNGITLLDCKCTVSKQDINNTRFVGMEVSSR
jgi:hypothetical protein